MRSRSATAASCSISSWAMRSLMSARFCLAMNALLTAYPLLGSDWQDKGANSMLVKPMNTNDLLRQIEALLISHEDKKKSRKEVAGAAASNSKRATTSSQKQAS